MLRDRFRSGRVVFIVIVGVVLSSCKTMEVGDQPTIVVDVRGPARQVQAFDRELRREFGEDRLVCVAREGEKVSYCGELQEKGVLGNGTVEYVLSGRIPRVFEKLGEAFGRVHEQFSAAGLTPTARLASADGLTSTQGPTSTETLTLTITGAPVAATSCSSSCAIIPICNSNTCVKKGGTPPCQSC